MSKQFTLQTGYMGLVSQRTKYQEYAKPLIDKFELDKQSLSPPHFPFSPTTPGDTILFLSHNIHRGTNIKEGIRISLTNYYYDGIYTK